MTGASACFNKTQMTAKNYDEFRAFLRIEIIFMRLDLFSNLWREDYDENWPWIMTKWAFLWDKSLFNYDEKKKKNWKGLTVCRRPAIGNFSSKALGLLDRRSANFLGTLGTGFFYELHDTMQGSERTRLKTLKDKVYFIFITRWVGCKWQRK